MLIYQGQITRGISQLLAMQLVCQALFKECEAFRYYTHTCRAVGRPGCPHWAAAVGKRALAVHMQDCQGHLTQTAPACMGSEVLD